MREVDRREKFFFICRVSQQEGEMLRDNRAQRPLLQRVCGEEDEEEKWFDFPF